LEEAESYHPDVLAGWFVEEARTPVTYGGRRPKPVRNPPQVKWSGQPKNQTSGPNDEIAGLVNEVRPEYEIECKSPKVGADNPVGSVHKYGGPKGFGKWAEAMADPTEFKGLDEASAYSPRRRRWPRRCRARGKIRRWKLLACCAATRRKVGKARPS